MAKKKLKPLPLYTKPAKSMREYVRRVLSMLKPGRWTQGARAKNALSHAVPSDDPTALQVCLLGALDRSDDIDRRQLLQRNIEKNLPKQPLWNHGDIAFYNDATNRKYSEVIALVKRAARQLGVKTR